MQEYAGLQLVVRNAPMSILADPHIAKNLKEDSAIETVQRILSKCDTPIGHVLIQSLFMYEGRVEIAELHLIAENGAFFIRQTLRIGADGQFVLPALRAR